MKTFTIISPQSLPVGALQGRISRPMLIVQAKGRITLNKAAKTILGLTEAVEELRIGQTEDGQLALSKSPTRQNPDAFTFRRDKTEANYLLSSKGLATKILEMTEVPSLAPGAYYLIKGIDEEPAWFALEKHKVAVLKEATAAGIKAGLGKS